MSAKTYEVTINLQALFPRDIDDDGNEVWWDSVAIASEIHSWLDDLGFNVQVHVKGV